MVVYSIYIYIYIILYYMVVVGRLDQKMPGPIFLSQSSPALRTNTDRNTGRGPPEWNRQTGTMAELGALEAMVVQGALEAMAELGALEAMAELGALETMAV